MNKPKALIVASVASMIQQFNMPNIKLLLDMGYKVDVACNFIDSGTIPSSKSEELMKNLEKLNVKYYQVDFDRNAFNLIQNIRAYKQMKKIMRNNYTLVHSHSPIGGVVARLTANKYRKKGLKSIYTAHGFHFYKGAPLKMWLIFYPVEKLLSYWTDVLVTINKEDYNLALKQMKSKKVEYIPGVGIDIDRFKPVSVDEKNMIRELKGYSNEDFIMIYVGELSTRKNQKMLLETIKKTIFRVDKLKLLLVGTGPLEHKYKKYVSELGIEEYVEFLGYRSDIPELMGMSDLAVSTSKQEGLPVNIMEAMATGIPLIVTNTRGNSDLVEHGKNGYIVSASDVTELKDSILNIYRDKTIAEKFSKTSYEMSQKYQLKVIMNYYKKIYRTEFDKNENYAPTSEVI